MGMETVTFDCPPDLLEDVEAHVEASPKFENRSQFLRYAITNALEHGGADLPNDMLERIDARVDQSPLFEDRGHFIRTAIRTADHFDSDEQTEFSEPPG